MVQVVIESRFWRKTFLACLPHSQGFISTETDVFTVAGTTCTFKVTPHPNSPHVLFCTSSHGAAACLVSNLQVVGHPGKAGGQSVTSKADLGHVRSGSLGHAERDACRNAAGIKGNGLELQCDCAAQQALAQQQVIVSDR